MADFIQNKISKELQMLGTKRENLNADLSITIRPECPEDFYAVELLTREAFWGYAAIAPAAATSEDTTLAMLIKYTNEEVVVMAVFNGVLCSAMVPILIRFFASI